MDASTSYVGYTILKDDGQYIDVGYLDLTKCNSLYEKSILFSQLIDLLAQKCIGNEIRVAIEAPLSRSNNVNVVNLLQRWSGMICLLIYLHLGVIPELVEHYVARKKLGIVVPRGVKGKDLKQFLFQFVRDLKVIPEDMWMYKKTSKPKDFCYDMTDSYIVAKSQVNG